ncbi:MAG: hypothetical protein E7184_01920 [Erysipelotrichaceae bacterium]|nr:hypothetical protein [Erysipelotrichaceae bacterium]
MLKKLRLGLIISTSILTLLFIVSLFNPFKNDDVRFYQIKNYYRIDISEEEQNDEDYLLIKIANTSNENIYNTEIVFGTKENQYSQDNYIWFRIIKVAKDDVITIKFYEDTGKFVIDSNESTDNSSYYNLSINPKVPDLDLERCMNISHVGIDSENPEITRLNGQYWTLEKNLLLSFSSASLIALVIVHFIITKEGKKDEKN